MEEFLAYVKDVQRNIPVNVSMLAKKLQITVVEEAMHHNIYGSISQNYSIHTIKVNSIFDIRIKRYILAHELSHFVLHPKAVLDKEGIENDIFFTSKLSRIEEEESDALAADILMPRNAITTNLFKIQSKDKKIIIRDMAKIFMVPEIAMAKKLGYYQSHVLGNFGE